MESIDHAIARLEYSTGAEREDIFRRVADHLRRAADDHERARVLGLVYQAGRDSVDCRED